MEDESQACVAADKGGKDPHLERKPTDVVPDGGWGWFVVFSVFVGNVLTDGTIGTFGLFYPFIKSEFNASPALASLTGSLIPATYMIAAPIIGALIHRFGCRRVSVVGGLVATVGLATAAFSSHIGTFAFFYGFLGGIGIGMNSLTGHLMVNIYFHKKRGIANGIVSAGAGVGVFIMAPLLQYLLANYSWRGTLLIYSGCVLQYCVCGMLMRPLQKGLSKGYGSDTGSGTEDMPSSDSDPTFPQPEQPLLKHKADISAEEHAGLSPPLFHSQDVGGHKAPSIITHFTSLFHLNSGHSQTLQRSSLPDLSKPQDQHQSVSSKNRVITNYRTKHGYTAKRVLSPKANPRNRFLNPLDRKDIFYSGSIYNLKEFQNSESVAEFVHDMNEAPSSTCDSDGDDTCPTRNKSVTLRKRLQSLTSRLIDLSVFRYNVYIPVLLGGIFIQMGQFIPLTFLPNYCYSIGLHTSDVTIIISVFGVTNIFGRLSAGCLANVRCISSLWLCTFGNFMSGVACGLFPFCTTLETLCLYAAGFGYFIGFFAPLQVLIMVEYIGVDKLTSAYGFLQLCKGPAALFGPPLAGMVYQWMADYSITLVVASVLFVLSAVSQATVPLINRFQRNRRVPQTFLFEISTVA